MTLGLFFRGKIADRFPNRGNGAARLAKGTACATSFLKKIQTPRARAQSGCRNPLPRSAGLPPGAPWPPRLPGKGDFRPGRVFGSLRAAGYDRWVSFEWEKRWHPEIEEPEMALAHYAQAIRKYF